MPLPSFFNHKQNRSNTALPPNNPSSSSLQQIQPPPPLPQHQQHHEYQAYSPPPDTLAALTTQQQHLALAQQRQQQQQQQQLQQQQQQTSPPRSQLPARHQSISGPISNPIPLPLPHPPPPGGSVGAQYGGRPDAAGIGGALNHNFSRPPGPLTPGGGAPPQSTYPGAAENNSSQQTLLADNTDNLSYTSNSSTLYGGAPDAGQQIPPSGAGGPPAPAKSTLRKPLLSSKDGSSGGGTISNLFSRHKHSDQQQESSGGPLGIGRKSSQRKSNPPTPQQSPNIPQQIDEDRYAAHEQQQQHQQQQQQQQQGQKGGRPQSLLPPTREQVDTIISGLRRSDTDAQTYAQRSPLPPLQQTVQRPGTAGQASGPYYNVNTGQYETLASPVQAPLAPGQQHHNPQPLNQQQQPPPQTPSHQAPPQQTYPGHQQPPHQQQQQQQQQPPSGPPQQGPPATAAAHERLAQQQQQQQQPPSYGRISSEFTERDVRNLELSTSTLSSQNPGGLAAPHRSDNQPVSPGASIHTIDSIMPGGNNPAGAPAGADAGRSATPTAGKTEGNGAGPGGVNMTPQQISALITDFDTLQGKYRKVKNLYFERTAECERLQNTMANQRLSLNRTALDDNQYSARFERLDGAIKNLAFEIRQSWKVIPGWLQPVVNPGAEVKGGREMTVVGRAAISRWVVDEILDRFFHPALEPGISTTLKNIENGIRRHAPQPQSIEEDDNLSSKVCTWRMSTIDGVGPLINSQIGHENVKKLTEFLDEKLTASLAMHLNEPLPPGLPGGVNTIVEIAVGLAENLPVESRDVRVWYPLPGERFDSVFMKGETGLPPLAARPDGLGPDGKPTTITVDGKPIGQVENKGATPPPPANPNTPAPPGKVSEEGGLQPSNSVKGEAPGKKQSVLKGIRGKLSGSASQPAAASQPPPPQNNPSQTSLTENAAGGPPPPSKIENAAVQGLPSGAGGQAPPVQPGQEKVRVAGFMAVEVRGKSILIKAPVWI